MGGSPHLCTTWTRPHPEAAAAYGQKSPSTHHVNPPTPSGCGMIQTEQPGGQWCLPGLQVLLGGQPSLGTSRSVLPTTMRAEDARAYAEGRRQSLRGQHAFACVGGPPRAVEQHACALAWSPCAASRLTLPGTSLWAQCSLLMVLTC